MLVILVIGNFQYAFLQLFNLKYKIVFNKSCIFKMFLSTLWWNSFLGIEFSQWKVETISENLARNLAIGNREWSLSSVKFQIMFSHKCFLVTLQCLSSISLSIIPWKRADFLYFISSFLAHCALINILVGKNGLFMLFSPVEQNRVH